jgi:futalosine hydrolase
MTDILVLTATAFEQNDIKGQLSETVEQVVSTRAWCTGFFAGSTVRLVETGIGAVNTTQALTCVLEFQRPQLVLQLGVGGAYVGAGLAIGDLAMASAEVYGDIGVRTVEGWKPATTIGIPLLSQGTDYFNHFPVDSEIVDRAEKILRTGARRITTGPFVTVQECSGTATLGAERRDRFEAICENMEGAPAAHVSRLYGVPFLELRGISNLVEDRRTEDWDLPLAAANAQEAGMELLSGWPDLLADRELL